VNTVVYSSAEGTGSPHLGGPYLIERGDLLSGRPKTGGIDQNGGLNTEKAKAGAGHE